MTEAVGRVLVIVPTYNERTNLPQVVARVRAAAPSVDVLVVDDGSPDGTGDAAEALAAGDAQVHVLHRSTKAGLGQAYLAGFERGLAAGYDVLVELDADGSHPPERLPAMLAALADADVVIGSRYVPGGGVVDWPRRRLLLSRGGNTYTRVVLRLPVHDATAGFRAYRASALRTIGLEAVESQGYCFQVDLTRRAVRAGLRVREVPITFVERVEGESKMSGGIVREALWRVTWWGAEDALEAVRAARRRRRP
jgi:dolichol-phosphate mannosyltransferase